MNCPHCASATTKEQTKKTSLSYRTFRCSACKHTFNERTGTPFNFLEYPTDLILLVVLWRLRYKLNLRDLAEMFLERGVMFTYEAVREWERRFAPLLTEQLRTNRRGQAGRSWYVDETYVRVKGKWCYLYRAIDHDGNLVDSRLSEKRDMEAAQRHPMPEKGDILPRDTRQVALRQNVSVQGLLRKRRNLSIPIPSVGFSECSKRLPIFGQSIYNTGSHVEMF